MIQFLTGLAIGAIGTLSVIAILFVLDYRRPVK